MIGKAMPESVFHGEKPKEIVVLHKKKDVTGEYRIVRIRCDCLETTTLFLDNSSGTYAGDIICDRCEKKLFVVCDWNPKC